MSQPSHGKRQVEVTRVYEENARALTRYIANIGGARSSKSHSVAQLLIRRFWNCPGRRILVTRKTFPALRITAYALIRELLQDYGLYAQCLEIKQEHSIIGPNGSRFVFVAIDNPQKIKSTEWNDIWLEEANEFTYEDFILLRTRLSARNNWPGAPPNQMFFSLNPDDENGWINRRLVQDPLFARTGQITVIHSTYRDNPFLGSDYIGLLEELREQDPDYWRIFGLGEWGKLRNIIYGDYRIVQPAEWPKEFDETIYGLDFGYNNPSALVEINFLDTEVYMRELLYQTHLTNSQLIDKMLEIIPEGKRESPIYADAAEPARIEEIAGAGFDIHPADKSVRDGILYCKRLKYYTTAESVNLLEEKRTYKWKTDKNGVILDDPVKFKDHLMDAKRYALYTHSKEFRDNPLVTAI